MLATVLIIVLAVLALVALVPPVRRTVFSNPVLTA